MNIWRWRRLACLGLLIVIGLSLRSVFAAGLVVPATRIGYLTQPITTNVLKPTTCDGINLSTIVTGNGTITGTSSNDLILGWSGADVIDGRGGDDCILGGGGDDTIDGGDGLGDVCIGGPGTDTFVKLKIVLTLVVTCEIEVQ